MSLNLFEVLPPTFIQESVATRAQYQNLDSLYELDNEVRVALLDLLRLDKLKFFYGIVYSCGFGNEGLLGDGDGREHYKTTPTPIDTFYINGQRIIQISAGKYHILILSEDGIVYSYGNNSYEQLGEDHSEYKPFQTRASPIDMSSMIDIDGRRKKAIQVAAGGEHSLVLCDDGTVYSFGSGETGQLGNGYVGIVNVPSLIPISNFKGSKITQISAGNRHSLFLSEDGHVYSCGFNYFGQTGNRTFPQYGYPTLIDESRMIEKEVIQISASGAYSLILSKDGTVYSFGKNDFGQLGRDGVGKIPSPILLDGKKVVHISAGYTHSLIVCDDGTVYGFGRNIYGELGIGYTTIDNVSVPTPVDTSLMAGKKCIQTSAGFDHSLFLCDDGSVFSCGGDVSGELGNGPTTSYPSNKIIPTPIDISLIGSKKVIQVAAGTSYSQFLT